MFVETQSTDALSTHDPSFLESEFSSGSGVSRSEFSSRSGVSRSKFPSSSEFSSNSEVSRCNFSGSEFSGSPVTGYLASKRKCY